MSIKVTYRYFLPLISINIAWTLASNIEPSFLLWIVSNIAHFFEIISCFFFLTFSLSCIASIFSTPSSKNSSIEYPYISHAFGLTSLNFPVCRSKSSIPSKELLKRDKNLRLIFSIS